MDDDSDIPDNSSEQHAEALPLNKEPDFSARFSLNDASTDRLNAIR